MESKNKKALILGGGSSKIGLENETDAAIFQTISSFKRLGIQSFLIDNNPFSVTLSEIPRNNAYIQSVNFNHVMNIIKTQAIDYILPTLGGTNAIQVAKELFAHDVFKHYHIQLLGISENALKMVGNPLRISQVIHDSNESTVPSVIIKSLDEAVKIVHQIGFPVIIKSIAAKHQNDQKICRNLDDFLLIVKDYLNNSNVQKCIIEQSISEYHSFSMFGIRDVRGTKIILSGLEDIDPVGIHSGDSLAIAPIQTLTDPEYQDLRNSTFNVMENLRINGFCTVKFAFDPKTQKHFITKIIPYYNRGIALTALTTAYPLLDVYTHLILGSPLSKISLSNKYYPKSQLLEPTLDHVVVRIPIWPFEDIPNADQHLDTVMKSVGSSIGVGRSIEEALLKALRSSQFNPRDVLPNVQNISNDRLINQLIHPKSSRILVLIEALRRHYPVEDLSELTKINSFYFDKLADLLRTENKILTQPLQIQTINSAHRNGFGDGMLSETWKVSIDRIREITNHEKKGPTYKMIEPSGGEFIQNIQSFYSGYERENESEQLSNNSALVIGRGGNQLGPNTSADYYTSELLIQLHKCGFQTIIMNNNPNAVSLSSQTSDKQYIEPVQLGDILNIIDLEQPKIIFIPGNRHFLVRELKKYRRLNLKVLPPDQETGVKLPDKASLGMDFFVFNNKCHLISPVNLKSAKEPRLKFANQLKTQCDLDSEVLNQLKKQSIDKISNSKWQGLVQVLFLPKEDGYRLVGIRPIRLTETIFLNHSTNINWIQILVKLYTKQLNEKELENILNHLEIYPASLKDQFPFKQLNLLNNISNSNQAVGAIFNYLNQK